jgi:predicted metal-dependent hydrolase
LGREYRIEIDTTGIESIQFARHFLVPSASQQDQRNMLKRWYITQAEETILPRVNRFARELGVSVGLAKIVDNRYRWGSCTVNDNVNFNWRLIKAPMFVIDYVIYHELAHLLEANHTPRFWNIIRAKIPTADKAKNWLKDHGQLLEEEL